jgi:hypothetical protein
MFHLLAVPEVQVEMQEHQDQVVLVLREQLESQVVQVASEVFHMLVV